MRKLLSLMFLLYGAASADAAEPKKWCLREHKTELVTPDNGPAYLQVAGKIIERVDTPNYLQFETIKSATEGVWDQEIVIFRDRVFWPERENNPKWKSYPRMKAWTS